MRDFGRLLLRVTLGGLLVGHGAQKLFGVFEGGGLEGTGQHFETLGLSPGREWARRAGMGEMTGGALTALGFLHPIGPIATLAPMIVAWVRAHGGRPIWITSGGAELPATNIAIAVSLAALGPGSLSMDHLFGIRVHPALTALAGAGIAAGTLMALSQPKPGESPSSADAENVAEPELIAAT